MYRRADGNLKDPPGKNKSRENHSGATISVSLPRLVVGTPGEDEFSAEEKQGEKHATRRYRKQPAGRRWQITYRSLGKTECTGNY